MSLREEFYVCGAAGYPDPFHCDTFEDAKRFAREHGFNHSTQIKVAVTIRRRVISDFEIVWRNATALKEKVT